MSAVPTVRIANPFGEGWITVNAADLRPGQRLYTDPGPVAASTPTDEAALAPVPDPAPLAPESTKKPRRSHHGG